MRYLAGPFASVLLTLTVFAQSPGLVEARKGMRDAVARQDKVAFAQFLSDDITSIDSAGRLRDKAAAVEEMPSGNAQVRAEISEYGTGAVIAIAYAGESPARIVQAWARDGDQWRMVAFQGVRTGGITPATQPSSALPASLGPQLDRDSIERTLRVARANDGLEIRDTSIRIHGTLAVANMRLRSADSAEFWRTAILVNERAQWRQATEITTPITGAARSSGP